MTPQLTMNGHKYDGELRAKPIFEELCKQFHPKQVPKVCDPAYDLSESLMTSSMKWVGAIESEQVPEEPIYDIPMREPRVIESDKPSHGHVIGAIILVVFFNLLLILYCVRKKQRENNGNLSSQVQE